jgi:hypothetical protein
MYRAGFIYNLTMPKPGKSEQFDRIINGDAVRHFVKPARVETGGSVYGPVTLLTFKHIISNSPSVVPKSGQRVDQLQHSR